MRRAMRLLCLALLTMFATAAAATSSGTVTIESSGTPEGFDELAAEREMLVDVFYGGRRAGEARVLVRPGFLQFKRPELLAGLIPNLKVGPELQAALGRDFPTHTDLVCSSGQMRNCGELFPEVAEIIFDEERFRVDLFVNPRWLRTIPLQEQLYLSSPTTGLSLTTSSGFALSGSSTSVPLYNFQNRSLLAFREARVRSDVSYASKIGFVTDTVAVEIDRPALRYSAGLFWAPGSDLIGQRRIVGLGVGTQFDTRADRETLRGTPLIVFLSHSSRVDIVVDGRLVSSASYEAGNNVIDTTSLPDGSYSLLLRIEEESGAVREERRFFVKNPQIAPLGHPIYFAYAGVISDGRPANFLGFTKNFYYQFGTARRLNDKIALDLSVIGTKSPVIEAGGWLITSVGRARLAALASFDGHRGALLQFTSGQSGRITANLDARKIWSQDGRPLIPLSGGVNSFDVRQLDDRQLGKGSFTQVTGAIGYRIGSAYLSIIGSLRKDKGFAADYSVGPSLSWPVANFRGLQINLQADAQLTRTTAAGFLGARIVFNRGRYGATSTTGRRVFSGRGSSRGSRGFVGDTTAHLAYVAGDTNLGLAAGLKREEKSDTGHAEATLYSRFGNARAEIARDFQTGGRTQYGVSFQTGGVAGGQMVALGGREAAESALIVSLNRLEASARFEILIDGQPRGYVRTGQQLPLFLQPYRAYSVRLRPVGAPSVRFDTSSREVTLYPGSVAHLHWSVERLATVFGRVVRKNGTPLANAIVSSGQSVGESNSDGFFQVEASANQVLVFSPGSASECRVQLGPLDQHLDYVRVGGVVCE